MLVEVKVPMLSESVAEATLLSWHKKQGEFVKRDENLIDIETDKVVLELPAPDSGVLVSIAKGDGGTVVSQEVIATIDTEATASAAAPAAAAVAPAVAPTAAPAAAPAPATSPAVMPAAQKIAAEQHVATDALAGSGRGGRVTKEDVLGAVQARAA
ncbi:MAG: biotin/lipoyl-containing protein, partial [Pseudomonadota bacterium]